MFLEQDLYIYIYILQNYSFNKKVEKQIIIWKVLVKYKHLLKRH